MSIFSHTRALSMHTESLSNNWAEWHDKTFIYKSLGTTIWKQLTLNANQKKKIGTGTVFDSLSLSSLFTIEIKRQQQHWVAKIQVNEWMNGYYYRQTCINDNKYLRKIQACEWIKPIKKINLGMCIIQVAIGKANTWAGLYSFIDHFKKQICSTVSYSNSTHVKVFN